MQRSVRYFVYDYRFLYEKYVAPIQLSKSIWEQPPRAQNWLNMEDMRYVYTG